MSFIGTITAIPGLVAYYPLNDTFTTQDIIGGRNATNTGGVTFTSTGAVFSGTNYLQIADADIFSVAKTGQLSVVATVEVSSWTAAGRSDNGDKDRCYWLGKVGNGSSTPAEYSFVHYHDPDTSGESRPKRTSLYHWRSTGGTGPGSYWQDASWGVNTPRMFVANIDNSTSTSYSQPGMIYLYGDGVLRHSNAAGNAPDPANFLDTTAPVRIGGHIGTRTYFKGKIRRVAFFDRKLTQTEITALYNARNDDEGSLSDAGGGSFGTLYDDFSGANNTSLWVYSGTATNAAGSLTIDPTFYGDTVNGVRSVASYDLTGSSIIFDLNAFPTAGAPDGECGLFIELTPSNNFVTTTNRLFFQFYQSAGAPATVETKYTTAGVTTTVATETRERYLRIRHASGLVYWERSADLSSWTIFGGAGVSTSLLPAIASLYVRVQSYGSGTGVYGLPSIGTAAAPPPPSGVVDEFTTKDLAKWTWLGAADVDGGSLRLSPTKSWDTADAVVSKATVDLTDGPLLFDVSGFPTNGSATLTVSLSTASDRWGITANRVWWKFPQPGTVPNDFDALITVGGNEQVIPGLWADPIPRWFRFRISSGNLLWESSANGSVWDVRRTAPTASLPALTALYVSFFATGTATATGDYRIGSVGVTPGAPPPTVPGPLPTIGATPDVEALYLDWSAPASDGGSPITAYVVTGGTLTAPVILPATAFTYGQTGLTPGQSYTYQVRARNIAGDGPAASVTGVPDFPAAALIPSEPTSVTATAGDRSAVVSWTAPATTNGTLTGYRIVDQTGATRASVAGTVLSSSVGGLVNGQSFTFRVAASNTNGEGLLSAPSNAVTPVPTGVASSPLVRRAPFGALTSSLDTAESAAGRTMQPVVLQMRFGGSFPAATIASIAARDRYPLLLLDMTGVPTASVASGSLDTAIGRLGAAIEATHRNVYVVPYFGGNDYRRPWSPLYGQVSPGYAEGLSSGTRTPEELAAAFRAFATAMRTASSYARLVWSVSVDPQPYPQAGEWMRYYPGPAADVVMLIGYNYGTGPIPGQSGLTVWRTPGAVFDAAYTTVVTGIADTTPVWLWTACHDPSYTYTPVGDGFSPGAVVPTTGDSKASWVADLLGSTSWPRVQAVVWDSTAGERNWRIDSSAASAAAFRAALGDPDGWVRTEIQQDLLGDYVRESVDDLADWARTGPYPATRANPYDRPDTRTGVRVSILHGGPFSSGPKSNGLTVTAADMERWNRVHGLVLRQAARNGAQAWAWTSGGLPIDHVSTLFPGTVSSGTVTLANTFDGTPGVKMQGAAGMRAAEAGSDAPITADAPQIVSTTPTQNSVSMTWAAPSGTPSSEIVGYSFSASGPGAFTPEWVSPVIATPDNPFVFTNMQPNTDYSVGIAAHTLRGEGVRKRKPIRTAPSITTPPSGGLPAKTAAIYWESYQGEGFTGSRITTLPTTANVINIFHCVPSSGDQSSDGAITWDGPPLGITMQNMRDDIAARRSTYGQKFVMTIGGAGARFNLGNRAASQRFIADFKAISDSLGGLDGIDLNNYEQLPSINTPEWVWALQQLRSSQYFGANFIITSPCTASYGLAQFTTDLNHLMGLHNGGVLNMVGPQFYESGTLVNNTTGIATVFNRFKAAGMPESKLGIGFSMNPSRPDSWTAANAAAAYTTTKAAFPQVRGAFNFSDSMDPTDTFAATVIPVILA